MSQIQVSYPVARLGLATSFVEADTPTFYALGFKNRFINAAGGAEKRRGIKQLGDDVPGTPNMTGVHELVDNQGVETLLASTDGAIYKFSGTSAYSQAFSGWDATKKIRSVQMGEKLIFFNGSDRNIFTTDASAFQRLYPVIEAGVMTGDTSAAGMKDSNITDWVTDTNIVINDMVYNKTLDAFGIINAVTTAQPQHTIIGSSQATGLGVASRNQDAGDSYQILDLVELNIIDVDGVLDNTTSLTSGSNATTIKVNGVDFSTTDIRAGDFIRNTTRAAVAMVSSISTSALTVTSVASQTGGDSLIFLKEAMPITEDAHVHFGRLYMVDTRDQKKIRITGPDNPQDLTSDAGTLDANTLSFGELQPQGDIAVAMDSFQRFFCVGGKENLFLYSGTDPILDTSAATKSFDIVGLFPQGVVAQDAMLSIGNDLVFLTPDGIQTATLGGDASQINRANLSESIKTTLRDLIANTAEDKIQALHYPKRSWFMAKIGTQIYVFNYTENFGMDQPLLDESAGQLSSKRGSWSLFDGKFAQQNAYYVRRNGNLVCAGDGGKVYQFDQDGVYDDDGVTYKTEYQSAWDDMTGLTRKFHDVKIKQVEAIKPIFEVGQDINYTIQAEGGFDRKSSETITVGVSGGAAAIGTATLPFTLGGAVAQNTKYPLRVRGEHYRMTFTTEDQNGPDVLSRYTLYINPFGSR